MPGSIVVGISELIQFGERPNPYADFADSSEAYVAPGRSVQPWKAEEPSIVPDWADRPSYEPSESSAGGAGLASAADSNLSDLSNTSIDSDDKPNDPFAAYARSLETGQDIGGGGIAPGGKGGSPAESSGANSDASGAAFSFSSGDEKALAPSAANSFPTSFQAIGQDSLENLPNSTLSAMTAGGSTPGTSARNVTSVLSSISSTHVNLPNSSPPVSPPSSQPLKPPTNPSTFSRPVLQSVEQFGGAGNERLLIEGSLVNTAPLGTAVTLDFFAKEPGLAAAKLLGSSSITQTTAGSIDFKVNLTARVPAGTVVAAAVHGRADGPDWTQSVELPGGGSLVSGPAAGSPGAPRSGVVTVPIGKKGESITLESPGHSLENIQVYAPPGLSDELPVGFVGFTVTNVPKGGSALVRMTLPNDIHIHTYYKHDPVTGAVTPFMFDGRTGAEIHGQVVTLHLVDGGPGDADGVANGVIVDPGGPGDNLIGNTAVVLAANTPQFVTLQSGPYPLNNVQTFPAPASAVVMPLGLFSYTITGLKKGGKADVTMTLPDGVYASH
jgi:hypothetical protein